MSIGISIVVAVFNGKKLLPRLLDSIKEQEIRNYELIVIDGGSTDGTVELIETRKSELSYWVSEKDQGIYDAWNKGVKKATKDWIMFLGSDDILLSDSLKKYEMYMLGLEDIEDVDYISSRVQMIDEGSKVVRTRGWKWEWPYFLKEMTVAHPGSLHSKKLFLKYGFFDVSYKITGDYEFLLRPGNTLNARFIPEITVLMSEGGASDSTKAMLEHKKAAVETGGASKFSAWINYVNVYAKFLVKKSFRRLGLNLYLKK